MSALLEARNVSLAYALHGGASVEALTDVSLEVGPGEAISILGPSGCGKSSLLSLFSGFRRPSGGRVLFRGEEIRGPSHERAIIFQDHALFPWQTASENIEFALRARGVPKNKARAEAASLLDLVELGGHGKFYPRQLSGGMQQRIGIARALAADPEVILLDEPFASLDVLTRNSVLQQLLLLAAKMGKALVLVTHNIEEALFVGRKVFLMSPGPGRVVETISISGHRPGNIRELRGMREFLEAESLLYSRLESFRQPN